MYLHAKSCWSARSKVFRKLQTIIQNICLYILAENTFTHWNIILVNSKKFGFVFFTNEALVKLREISILASRNESLRFASNVWLFNIHHYFWIIIFILFKEIYSDVKIIIRKLWYSKLGHLRTLNIAWYANILKELQLYNSTTPSNLNILPLNWILIDILHAYKWLTKVRKISVCILFWHFMWSVKYFF